MLSYHFYKNFNETVTQWYIKAISTWSENFLSFEVEYALQNAKCMLFNTVFFKLDCTTVSKWWKVETYETCWTMEICTYFIRSCKPTWLTTCILHCTVAASFSIFLYIFSVFLKSPLVTLLSCFILKYLHRVHSQLYDSLTWACTTSFSAYGAGFRRVSTWSEAPEIRSRTRLHSSRKRTALA